jgi:hypothetical protein
MKTSVIVVIPIENLTQSLQYGNLIVKIIPDI